MEHKEFDKCLELVKSGNGIFYIPTYSRITKIDKKCIDKFSAVGLPCIWKSNDGSGYRLASGKSNVYIFQNQLHYSEL
jgi:hypothetical protein